MTCTSSSPCHIKRVYIENNAHGARYKGELCTGCSWWQDKEPDPSPCPDPLCLLDLDPYSLHCIKCQEKHRPGAKTPRWGGRRPGAGAPRGNLNHLVHGRDSHLIRRAVDVLAENPELRPFLLLIARAAVQGEIPQTTRQLILEALGKTIAGVQVAARQLRRLRQ